MRTQPLLARSVTAKRFGMFLGLLLSMSGLLLGCQTQLDPKQVWFPLIRDFFSYMEQPSLSEKEKQYFEELFTTEGRRQFFDLVGGSGGFRQSLADQRNGTFPWPGHFQSFILGLGKTLANVSYNQDGKTALATTIVSQKKDQGTLSYGMIYRFTFAEEEGKWKIQRIEFARKDPTIGNINPYYAYSVAGFFAFQLLAWLPFITGFFLFSLDAAWQWMQFWYRLVFYVYMSILSGILHFGGGKLQNLPLSSFAFILCPALYFFFARGFALAAPQTFNSHVGFLLLLLMMNFFLGLLLLKETYNHYLASSAQDAMREAQRRVSAVKNMADEAGVPMSSEEALRLLSASGRLPRMEFDRQRYQKTSIALVLFSLVCVVAAFLPYKNKFQLSVTSTKEIGFVVDEQVELVKSSPVYRVPNIDSRYKVGDLASGTTYSKLEKVNAQDGVFYLIRHERRSLAYVPAQNVKELDKKVSFQLEGDYLNYLDDLGIVKEPPASGAKSDPEDRIIADAYLKQAQEAFRLGSLQGYTRALNEINRATSFDPPYADLYLHRAYILVEIGRFLREDSLYNMFGLSGETLANPNKVDVLFERALENIEIGRRLGASPDVANAVTALGKLYEGEANQEAIGKQFANIHGEHLYILQVKLLVENDLQQAGKLAEDLLRLQSDNVRFVNNRGLLQLRQGTSLARDTFIQATRISPSYTDGLLNLATVELRTNTRQGLQQLEQLIRDEPNFPNKAQFYLRYYRWHQLLRWATPFLGLCCFVGLLRLVRPNFIPQHTFAGTVLRVLAMLFLFVIISLSLLTQTLPTHSLVGDILPL